MINSNNEPYARKKISSTLLTLSAIALLLLGASPMLLFNPILQPVQAQTTTMTFKTPTPAGGGTEICFPSGPSTLTFEAQGTPSSHNRLNITSGTFKVTDSINEQKTYSGILGDGSYANSSGGGVEKFGITGRIDNVSKAADCGYEGYEFSIDTQCSTSNDGGTPNPVSIITTYRGAQGEGDTDSFKGVVECSPSQGGGGETSPQSSSTSSSTGTTTTAQDKDSDGIPDANDKCPNLPNTRCYKEGDTAIVVHNRDR